MCVTAVGWDLRSDGRTFVGSSPLSDFQPLVTGLHPISEQNITTSVLRQTVLPCHPPAGFNIGVSLFKNLAEESCMQVTTMEAFVTHQFSLAGF